MNNFTKITDTLARPYIRWSLLAVFFLTLPWTILVIPIFQANNFTYSQLSAWLILAVAALGLNILTGLTGMISVGHSAIYAVGAFVGGYFVSKAGLPFPIALLCAAIGGGLVALILGLPALKLSGSYLAIATFAFAVAMPQFLSSSKELGSLFADPNDPVSKIGVFKIPRQVFPGFEVRNDLGRYYLFLAVGIVMFLLAVGIWNSRTGRAFRAIRDSETAAIAMGVNLGYFKVLAFVISGLYAGVAGAMYAAQVGQIEATDGQFTPVESVIFLAAIILGGLGSIWGAVVGSGLLIFVPILASEARKWIDDAFKYKIDNFESIFYGLILILCIFFMPNGITGAVNKWYNRLRDGKQIEDMAAEIEDISPFQTDTSPVVATVADASSDAVVSANAQSSPKGV